MLLYLFLLQISLVNISIGQRANANFNSNGNRSKNKNKVKWYGPSYQPSWWNPDDYLTLRGPEFTYEGSNSPSTWSQQFSECGGTMQSPINIQTNILERRQTRRPLTWNNYSNPPKTMVLENSKYSIHGTCIWDKTSEIPYITNGPLENRYYFSQLHFHWGSNSSRGSEHTVDGKRYPLEMHVVHDRQDDGESPQNENPTEIVVIGYLFEKSRNDNPNLKAILDRIKEVEGSAKKKTFVTPFSLDSLIPNFNRGYATYKGSLTTPPCSEGVVWIINSQPLTISERQLTQIRKSVRDGRGRSIQNFRPLQNLNGRDVYYVP